MKDESYPGEADEAAAAEAACTPPPHQEGMTREEFLRHTNHMRNCGFLWLQKDFDAHDAALRETITRLEDLLELTKENERFLRDTPWLQENASLQARLTASEAKRKWTTEKPKVAGWYWWRYAKGSTEHIIKVYESLAVEGLSGEADHVDEIEGEFQGPLTPGEE